MEAAETNSISKYWREAMVWGLSIPIFVWVAMMPPYAQDLSYHDFADQRLILGIPHFWNVVSNLPFAAIGFLGCRWLMRAGRDSRVFAEPWERNAYFVFFFGEFLTCLGSAYYHAGPNNNSLVWDRLVFILLLTAVFPIVVTEFIDKYIGKLLLTPQVLIGLFSVLYWNQTELASHGDLRLYILVQFYPVFALPVILMLFRSAYTHSGVLLWAWALFAIAKLCESYDKVIYQATGFWSGHTLKHFVAAAATYVLLYGLQRRCIRRPAIGLESGHLTETVSAVS